MLVASVGFVRVVSASRIFFSFAGEISTKSIKAFVWFLDTFARRVCGRALVPLKMFELNIFLRLLSANTCAALISFGLLRGALGFFSVGEIGALKKPL